MDAIFISNINCESEEVGVPIGILSICSILQKKVKVEIIDFNDKKYRKFYDESIDITDYCTKLAKFLVSKKCKIISFYTMCDTYHMILYISKQIKEMNSEIKIILGGPQATLTGKETLERFEFIDIIGHGEGEKYIESLITKLLHGDSLIDQPGILFRNNGEIIKNEKGSIVEELDDLPFINYELIDMSQFDIMTIEIGRGCPFSCTFCSSKTFFQRNFRIKSISRLIKEILYLKKNYGIHKFRFLHDLFTANRVFVKDLCNTIIESKMEITWYCSARVDTLDRDLIEVMKKAGCEKVFLGIESGSSRMQKELNKNINLELVYSIIEILLENNIDPVMAFIFGFPNEEYSDLKDTIDMILYFYNKEISMIQLNVWTPLPQTELTNTYFDKLQLNQYDSGLSGNTVLHIENDWMKGAVKDNKIIFPQYYQVNTALLNEVCYLDKFINGFFRVLYKTMPQTFKKTLGVYNNNLIELFIDFKKVNPNFIYLCDYLMENDFNIVIKRLNMFRRFLQEGHKVMLDKELLYTFEKEALVFKLLFLKQLKSGGVNY